MVDDVSGDARVWDLDQILPLESFDKEYEKAEATIPKAAQDLARLSPDMSGEAFKELMDEWEEESRQYARLSGRPGLEEATDLEDQATQQRVSRLHDLDVRISEAGRPASFWLQGKDVAGKKTLDDENAKRLFAAVPDEEYGLLRSRILAKHTLSLKEEDVSSAKNANLHTALIELRAKIEKNQRYAFAPEGKKARVIETTAEIMQFVHSNDAAEREAAYRATLAEFTRNEELYFPIYTAIVKDWVDAAKRRGYASPIAMRNTGNDIPDEAIEVLMQVCASNTGIFQEYFRWKAGKLGIKKLRRFDVYAPLQEAVGNTTLDAGIAMTLDTFRQVSHAFHDHAKRIIDENHIHSHPDPKKESGAYCATIVPDLSPYVFLNWTGKPRDVSTLAHELGHGVHALYAAHHGIGTQHAPLPLSETASTFAESILFERQLAEAPDDATRVAMLSEKISDSYATIIRQNNIVRFELMAHERIPQGITRDELSAMWLQTLHDQFGDAVEVDESFRHEWAYLPHIVNTPFYCYAYSFGELLSLSLYARYKKDPSFFGQIERILASGGAEEPDAVLKRAGVDMRDPTFWQGSFDIIGGWMRQLKAYDRRAA